MEKIFVTGTFPQSQNERGILIETIRDSADPDRLMFLIWEGETATILPHIERKGRMFLPPDPASSSFPRLSLPDGLRPCDDLPELFAKLASTISNFIRLRHDQLTIVIAFVLASWFPDCFEAAPYLWVVGPFGSAKTTLLKLLYCLCRRGLIAGDLRSGSIYKLTDTWNPTLIIDELELRNSGADSEMCRLLRSGSTRGVPTFRNNVPYSTYGLKVVASRQPLNDAALLSRGTVISLLPTDDELPRLDEAAMQQIVKEYQNRLLVFRLKNYIAVQEFRMPPDALKGLSPRTQQIARALAAPLLGNPKSTADLVAFLGQHDKDARVERFLEPEWLVGEGLFDLVHQGAQSGRLTTEVLIGGVARHVNLKLKNHGEEIKLSARKAGAVVKSLGLGIERLGRLGRGLRLTVPTKRKVHEIARQLGIDRRTVASSSALETGAGGVSCSLCEEFGLSGGLRFIDSDESLVGKASSLPKRPRLRPNAYRSSRGIWPSPTDGEPS
jgi:hypothetical protein